MDVGVFGTFLVGCSACLTLVFCKYLVGVSTFVVGAWRAPSCRYGLVGRSTCSEVPDVALKQKVVRELPSSGLLHSEEWQFLTDVSAQPICPILGHFYS